METPLESKYEPLLTTEQVALMLDCAKQTIYQSRSSGKLFGVKAPRFIKKGGRVVYRQSTLEQFMSQFQEYDNTSQYPSTVKSKQQEI